MRNIATANVGHVTLLAIVVETENASATCCIDRAVNRLAIVPCVIGGKFDIDLFCKIAIVC